MLGESGADASMEEIAARAGVGVGTVYRRFANKDALIDELVRLSMAEALDEARQALERPDGEGLERFLRGLGALFAAHAKYAHLLLERSGDSADALEIRAAVQELTRRALDAGTLNPDVTVGDVMSLVWGMRGLTETTDEVAPGTWQRFLDIHLAGLRAPARSAPPRRCRPDSWRSCFPGLSGGGCSFQPVAAPVAAGRGSPATSATSAIPEALLPRQPREALASQADRRPAP